LLIYCLPIWYGNRGLELTGEGVNVLSNTNGHREEEKRD
jgi:hypothetical protein